MTPQLLLQFATNHLLLVGALIAILLAFVVLELQEKSSGILRLTPHQVVQNMNHNDSIIIDIRPAEAYQQQRIINTINLVPGEITQNPKKLGKSKEKLIIVVCQQGLQAGQSARKLRAAGYQKVAILEGGIQQWQTAGLPVIKG